MRKKIIILILFIITPFFVYALPKGDVNGDNKVDTMDYTLIHRYVTNQKKLSKEELKRADVSGDNKVDNVDYSMIKKMLSATTELKLTAPCCDTKYNTTIESDFGCNQCTRCNAGACPTATPKATSKPKATPKSTSKPKITCKNATYTGKNLTIATCSGGKISNEKHKNVGSYKVSCKGTGGVTTKSCSIKSKTVTPPPTTKPKVTPQPTMKPTATPKTTAKATATPTPESTDPPIVSVTGISLNKSSSTIKSGNSLALKATISPSNATDKNVTWTSSDTNIASVESNGVVRANKIGTVTITAKASDENREASCEITVKPKSILFVGNSKTYRGSDSHAKARISTQFVTIATGRKHLSSKASNLSKKSSPYYIGISDEVGIVTYGGKRLIDTLSYKTGSGKMPFKDAINKNKNGGKVYDIIVVQEHTATTREYPDQFYDGVKQIIELQGGKNYNGILYIRTSFPHDDKDFDKNLASMNANAETVAKRIRETYSNLFVYVIHDGDAFALAKQKGITVYRTKQGDDNHQNENGAYLAALCMYVKIYHENATKVSNNLYTSSSSVADKLKTIANSVCK